jgi:4-amino-4-deoxy-L-arabinose transferase-like glycosyltransferase
LGLVAAPFSIAGIKTAFGATPPLWAVIGHGYRANSPRWRIVAIVLVITQYLGLAILLSSNPQFADYDYWPEVPFFIHAWSVATIGLYALAQIAFWWGIAVGPKRI